MKEIIKELIISSGYFSVAICLITFVIGMQIKKKINMALSNPLLISVILTIIILSIFEVDYESFNKGGQYLTYFLTPVTVCLAIPLYEQQDLLKKNFKAIFIGIFSGIVTCLVSIYILSILFNLSHELYLSLLPKSVTNAIGMAISEEIGGLPAVTVAAIVITGTFGNVVGESVCKFFKIKHPVSVGLSLGTAAHAMGTSKAIELGEAQGAMSGLSIGIAGLMTVVLAPIFAIFL